MTRKQREKFVKDEPGFFEVYKNLETKAFLEFILNYYENFGIEELQRDKLRDLVKLKLDTTKDAKTAFGDMKTLLVTYYKLHKIFIKRDNTLLIAYHDMRYLSINTQHI